MDRIVNFLFKWEKLRVAIFREVEWENSLGRIIKDPESMKTGSLFWCDIDGWRGWTQTDDMSYYFHDIPEKDIGDIFDIFYGKSIK